MQLKVKEDVWYLFRSASSMGEYRGIMNLCRVLPQGTAAKLVVDKAIDRLPTIGSIREDIQRCPLQSWSRCCLNYCPVFDLLQLLASTDTFQEGVQRCPLHCL